MKAHGQATCPVTILPTRSNWEWHLRPHDLEPLNCPITGNDRAPKRATAACNVHAASITAGLFEYCTVLYVLAHAPHFSSIPLALVAVRREKKKTASLGSQVPQPISAVGIRSHQHTRPSSNILTFCPSGNHRHQSSRSLPPTANLPWPHVATGSPRGVIQLGSLWGRSFITMLNCQTLFGAVPAMPLIRHVSDTGAGYSYRWSVAFQLQVPCTCYHLKPSWQHRAIASAGALQ